jgi:hypothetical protein
VNAFDVVALIIGVFFVVGVVVGSLLVIAIPALTRIRSCGGGQLRQFHPDPEDPPNLGPPGQPAPSPPEELDDRDDNPWWPSQR